MIEPLIGKCFLLSDAAFGTDVAISDMMLSEGLEMADVISGAIIQRYPWTYI